MELVRYNTFYRDVIRFNEVDSEKIIPKLWKYIKNNDDSICGFKKLKVRSYEELITVLGMAIMKVLTFLKRTILSIMI